MICLIVFCLPLTCFGAENNTVTIAGFTYSYYDDLSKPEYNMHALFTSSTGNPVYCGNHGLYTPIGEKIGDSKTLEMHPYEDELVRKVLYYGYLGPKEWEGFSEATNNDAYNAIDSVAKRKWCGNAVTGIALTRTQGKGYFYDVAGFNNFWEYILEAPSPPSGFKTYIMYGSNDTQDLFIWTYNPVGNLGLKKDVSKNLHIIDFNKEHYSLADAEYAVSLDEDFKTVVGTLYTDEKGESNILNLSPGIYYIKETSAPKGFKLDKKVYKLEVNEDDCFILNVKEEPEIGRIDMLLQKEASKDGKGLEGAIFKVNYYNSIVDDVSNLMPSLTWYFKTDSNGFVYFEESYRVDGDELLKDEEGHVIAPIGTYQIVEEVPPKGYIKTDEAVLRQVTWNQDDKTWSIYKAPIFKNSEIPKKIIEEPKKERNAVIPATGDNSNLGPYLLVIFSMTGLLISLKICEKNCKKPSKNIKKSLQFQYLYGNIYELITGVPLE